MSQAELTGVAVAAAITPVDIRSDTAAVVVLPRR